MTGSSAGRVPSAPPAWVAVIQKTARGGALVGGGVMCGLSILVVFSILGREMLRRPIPGDFEIVAIGTAITAFLCLPYCQLHRGNLVVDFFLSRAPARVRGVLDGIAASLFGAVALVLAWRMTAGLLDAIAYRDVSIILGLPLWWAYPFAVFSLVLLAAACVVTALRDWGGRPW